jgi:hypothetical protein
MLSPMVSGYEISCLWASIVLAAGEVAGYRPFIHQGKDMFLRLCLLPVGENSKADDRA